LILDSNKTTKSEIQICDSMIKLNLLTCYARFLTPSSTFKNQREICIFWYQILCADLSVGRPRDKQPNTLLFSFLLSREALLAEHAKNITKTSPPWSPQAAGSQRLQFLEVCVIAVRRVIDHDHCYLVM
jgi:hypothetical protein